MGTNRYQMALESEDGRSLALPSGNGEPFSYGRLSERKLRGALR